MKAARLHAPGDLRIDECLVPSPSAHEVVLKVLVCGICGSDIPRITTNGTYRYPTTLGHEFMGIVVQVGHCVSPEALGRRAAVIPLIGCQSCEFCRVGLFFHCSRYNFLGSRCDGGFAEFVLVPFQNLVFLDANVGDFEGALMEPATVGLHTVRRSEVHTGDTVVVFGAGAIGLFAAQWARLSGASCVVQVDVRDDSLKIARDCGGDVVIHAAKEDPVDVVLSLTRGKGADLAIEAAGTPESSAQAFRCVRRRGRIALVGRVDGEWLMPEDVLTGLLRKEQTVYGNWGFDVQPFPANDWTIAAEAFSQRRLTVLPMITHLFRLEEIHRAVRMMSSRSEFFCKVMIVMDEKLQKEKLMI